MLSKLRLGPKLLLAPLVVLILLLMLSAGTYYGLVRQNRSLENIVQQRAARIRAASELVACANRVHTQIYQLLAWMNGSFSRSRIDTLVADIHRRQNAIDRRYIELDVVTPGGSAERKFVEQSQAAHGLYVKAVNDVIELGMTDGSIAANAMSKAERAFDVVALRLADLSKLEQDLSERAYLDAEADFRLLSILLPVVVALSIALSLLVTMLVRRALLTEIGEINSAALGLAQGNLTVRERTYGNDEIADTSRALDSSIRNLNATLSTILASAQSIDHASREMAEGQAGLSARAVEQASSIGQTASSMQALAANADRTADSVRLAKQLALCAGDFAVRGGSVVQRLVVTMASIRGTSSKVFEIVSVMDGIAVQSKVLARDAAAEAERAGRHGRGFATVASDAGTLARRSADAAQEIKTLIAASAAEIERGRRAAGEAGDSMAGIVGSVQQFSQIVGLISQASAQQMQGLSAVNQAILHVDKMSQQHSALVTEAAAAAAGLQDQATSLSQAVASFKLGDGEGNTAPSSPGDRKHQGPGSAARLRLASNRV
jgi:methyl-accepting chemotaxis protein